MRSAAPILLPKSDTGVKVNGHARASHAGGVSFGESGFTAVLIGWMVAFA